MELEDFRIGLQNKLENQVNPRPFVCEGSPLECEVFIVGINPATTLKNDFWAFWSDDGGFNKTKWLEYYISERQLNANPEKRRPNRLSNTRQRIEWITESANPVKILETNLFAKATKKAKELTKADKENSVFYFLLETIKPKLIFIHGKKPKEYFEKHYGLETNNDGIGYCSINGLKTKVIAKKHLAIGWSKDNTLKLGAFLKSEIYPEG